jgi:hypothetical protein
MLPIYMGFYIGRNIFKKKWLLPFELIAILEIALYANRGALLSAIIFWAIINLLYLRPKVTDKIKFITLSILIIVPLFFIMEKFIDDIIYMSGRSIDSYALSQYKDYIQKGDINRFFSNRLYIWELSREISKDNLLFGKGTAYFEATYGYYTHNIFYDMLVQYGIFGLILSIIIITYFTIMLFKKRSKYLLLGVLFFCLSFPKLMLSYYLLKDYHIWCFMGISVLNYKHINKNTVNVNNFTFMDYQKRIKNEGINRNL